MVDISRLKAQCDGEIVAVRENADTLEVTTTASDTVKVDREAVLRDSCKECRFPMPENTDAVIEGKPRLAGDGGKARLEAFAKKSHEERWDYFSNELEKCIRCNACRQACPTCWCKECFAEQTDLKWIGSGSDLTDAMIFQITRIYHQAGRCVECDACYSACPMGVDLRTYTNKIAADVKELFNYLPDFDPETSPPLATFSEADSDAFITDPEQNHE
jgi:ferredoxin